MIYKFSLSIIACALLFVSCSSKGASSASNGEIVVIEDGYNAKAKKEIVIDEAAFTGKNSLNSGEKISSSEMTKIAADSSRIDTMYDGFGNRTDTRCFNYNPRVKCVLVRSGVDGQKQIFVYASDGEVKKLSDDMFARILTLPAGEIAIAAGITQDFVQPPKPTIVRNNPPAAAQMRPLPSYYFPVQQPPAQIAAPAEPAAETPDAAPAPGAETTRPTDERKDREPKNPPRDELN